MFQQFFSPISSITYVHGTGFLTFNLKRVSLKNLTLVPEGHQNDVIEMLMFLENYQLLEHGSICE